ncbi:MAG: RND transporter [Mesorhizobium sp. SCN 65-20]|nr:MAG: RND transporter [Mesorhizobium sp. SCN 65-20]
MKYLIAAALIASTAGSAFAQAAPVSGTVTKINEAQSKITLKHGPIVNLGMDGMTMVFTLAEPSMIEGLKVGDNVKFEADRVNGRLTVTKIDAAQ